MKRWQEKGQQPTLGHILTPARYQLLLVAQKQKPEAKQKNQNGQKTSRSTKNFRLSLYNIYIIYICMYLGMYFLLVGLGPTCQPGPELCQSCGARKMSTSSEGKGRGEGGEGGGKLHKTNAVNLQHAASLGSAH